MFVKVVFVTNPEGREGLEQLTEGSVNTDTIAKVSALRLEDIGTRWTGPSARTFIILSDGSVNYITTPIADFEWTIGAVDVIADGVIPGQQPVAPEPARPPAAGNVAWDAIDGLRAMNDNQFQQLMAVAAVADANNILARGLEPARAPEPQAQPEDNNIAPPRRWNLGPFRDLGDGIDIPVVEEFAIGDAGRALAQLAQDVDNVPDF